jgi:hypothetical protein
MDQTTTVYTVLLLIVIIILFLVVVMLITGAIIWLFYWGFKRRDKYKKYKFEDITLQLESNLTQIQNLEFLDFKKTQLIRRVSEIKYDSAENSFSNVSFAIGGEESNDKTSIACYITGVLSFVPTNGHYIIKTKENLIKIEINKEFYAKVYLDDGEIGGWKNHYLLSSIFTNKYTEVDLTSIFDPAGNVVFTHTRPKLKLTNIEVAGFSNAPGLDYEIKDIKGDVIATVKEGASILKYFNGFGQFTDNFELKFISNSLSMQEKALIVAFVMFHKI